MSGKHASYDMRKNVGLQKIFKTQNSSLPFRKNNGIRIVAFENCIKET